MELDCTYWCCFLFVKDTANTESYTYGHTLSLHDALPICLDDDPQFLAQEIGDKIGNRRLPAEFEAQKPAPPKHSPERLLGFRSEEHTSELQSLMRISYAVFCLQKKIQNSNHTLS